MYELWGRVVTSDRNHGNDIKFLLILIIVIAVITAALFATKDSEIRDLQRRVGQLEVRQ